MVGRQSHFGPVGLGLENPSEHICPGLYQGQEDRQGRVGKGGAGDSLECKVNCAKVLWFPK